MGGHIFSGLLTGFTARMLEDEERQYQENLAKLTAAKEVFTKVMSDPETSEAARGLAMKGLISVVRAPTITQPPVRGRREKGRAAGRGEEDVLGQLMAMPVVSEPSRPPVTYQPPSALPGVPSMPQELPGIPERPGLFLSPEQKAQRAVTGARAMIPVQVEAARALAGLEPEKAQARIDFIRQSPHLTEDEKHSAIAAEMGVPQRPGAEWTVKQIGSIPIGVLGADGTFHARGTAMPPGAQTALEAADEAHRLARKEKEQDRRAALEQQMTMFGIRDQAGLERQARADLAKYYRIAEEAQNRLRVMEDIRRFAQTDERLTGAADVVLLALHMGMSVGQVKGMRMGQQILAWHEGARSFLQGLGVRIESFMTGARLAPEQRDEFLRLARERAGHEAGAYDSAVEFWKDQGAIRAIVPPSPAARGAGPGAAPETGPVPVRPQTGRPGGWE